MKIFRAATLFTLAPVFLQINVDARSEARDQINHVFSVENPSINTRSNQVHHDSSFNFTFFLEDHEQQIKLVLEPNQNILSKNAHIEYLDGEGKIRHSEPINRQAHKVFKGSAWVMEFAGNWERAGWARVYVKRDGPSPLLEGAFSIWGDHHHIQSQSSYTQTKRDADFDLAGRKEERMVVYRDSDMAPIDEWKRDTTPASRCPADELLFNSGPNNPIFSEAEAELTWNSASLGSIANRQIIPGGNSGNGNLRETIGSLDGCPSSPRVALIGIATDCSYTASFDNANSARDSLIAMVNTASDVYERTFDITIGLQNLTISDAACPSSAADSAPWNVACVQNQDIEDKLELFSAWRGGRNDNNAYWSLMTSCRSGGTVGIAWLGQLCVASVQGFGSQSVTGANVIVRTPGEWQVFAHETGHTFGAVHDCDTAQCQLTQSSQQCCPVSSDGCDAGGRYLMNPTSSTSMSEFSPCTVGNICSALGSNRVRSRCLVDNVNVTTINGAQCGNGVVEEGEQCDCGSAEECGNNSCCDPGTCQFRNGAVCDDSNEACCSSCQFASANTVCRDSRGPCDIEEVCSGSSGTCPTDAYRPNGGSCGNGTDLFCAEGQCTSRDLQCQLVVIQGTSSNYTSSCDEDSCRLRCSPRANSQFCSALNRNLLDGTPCDGGLCNSGRCSGSGNGPSSGDGDSVSSWVDRHRGLVIGLSAGLGSLVLLLLACSIWACCRRSKRNKVVAPISPQRPMGQQFQGIPPPYPSPAYSSFMARQNHPPPLVRYA